jgi:uncharacterized damage-inducible protein DinB
VDIAALLVELYDRVPPLAQEATAGLDPEQLAQRPTPETNSIGWLIWHLARVQDHHVAELLDAAQVWTAGDWARRFGLTPDAANTGYGHGPDDVATIRPETPELLTEYLGAVYERTRVMLAGLTPEDLDRVVDTRWDPPVTLGVRLVSIADDSLQHAGQAAYVRGLLGA